MTNQELARKANELRIDILRMIYRAKTGHIGGDFSVIDMITALYYKHLNIPPRSGRRRTLTATASFSQRATRWRRSTRRWATSASSTRRR